jgi:two-component system NtrC family sensor kinase
MDIYNENELEALRESNGTTGMTNQISQRNNRILVIDDNQAIHDDFKKILRVNAPDHELSVEEAELFGDEPTNAFAAEYASAIEFEIDSALQGQEGLEMVRQAVRQGRPYAMAFVDVRMPPGWDGIETVARIWAEYPELEVVISTAYSDYSWSDMTDTLGHTDRLLILKKPFDNVEVSQLACALTAKWSLGQELSRKMDDLELIVATRTRDLETQKKNLEETVAQLQQIQSQLLQADKMASIGQLAAGVAHEINNPIGFISSNLNSLGQYVEDIKCVLAAHDKLLDECQQHVALAATVEGIGHVRKEKDIEYVLADIGSLLEESVEGAQRVRQIVADLRDFSHVDNPDAAEEDINGLIDKTINVAWNELKYKTEVVREFGQIPVVACFGGKLGQVFLNLLVNAAQAIEERGTITVRTGQEDDYVWIEVADTGSGIPPENLNRIFDPFFTTKEVGKGTGLGLNLAYNIVRAHSGQISVSSVLGEGTTFRIQLPIRAPTCTKEKDNERVA